MRSAGLFLLAALALIGASAVVLAMVFDGPGEREAVVTSALVALVVQVVGFLLVRRGIRSNMIAAWGLGMGLRFLTLVVYAFVAVGALGLPSGAALMSLATFLFVSTLVEPLLLKP